MYNYNAEKFSNYLVNRIKPPNITEITGECETNLTYRYYFNTSTLIIEGSGYIPECSSGSPFLKDLQYSAKHIIINNDVSSIGRYAFNEYIYLLSVNISDSVTSIGSYAFHSCDSLTTINIPSGVESISSYLFNNCYDLSSISISDTVNTISENAFYNCIHLETIDIPKSVTSISKNAFYKCVSLKSVTINSDEIMLDDNSFSFCHTLSNFTFNSYKQPSSAFARDNQLKSINVLYNYRYETVFGMKVNRVAPYGINELSGECGPNLTYTYDFNSSTLTITGSGDMPTYTSDDSPFQDIKYVLQHIKIEENVSSIGSYAFNDCKKLEYLTIDGNLSSILSNAFNSCPLLKSVSYKGFEKPKLEANSFNNCSNLMSVDVSHYYEDDKFGDFDVRKPICNSDVSVSCLLCDYDNSSECLSKQLPIYKWIQIK